MKRGVVVIAGLLLCGGIGWWWLRAPRPATSAGQAPDLTAPRPEKAPAAVPAGAPPESAATRLEGATSPAAAERNDYARFHESKDFYAYAEELLPLAKQGDASAQFYLSSALSYCEGLYDWYFIEYTQNGTRRQRTLDEALQLTAERKVFQPDDVRDIQQRCQKLRSIDPPPFGTSREWLDAAIALGFPMAQASEALNLALQGQGRSNPEKAQAARGEARQLALVALRTRDPMVMAQMGDIAANLAGEDSGKARIVRWAWPLAACQREANCRIMGDWMRLFCNIDTQCQPFETPVDIIRRQAGNDYDEVERMARELNEKLDAGTLGEGDL